MGKGDKKSKRGKIIIGTYGVRRPRKSRKPAVGTMVKKTTAPKAEKVEEVKKTAAKKVAPKKPKKEKAKEE